MSTAVHRSPNKLWRSNSIFNPMVHSAFSKVPSLHHNGAALRRAQRSIDEVGTYCSGALFPWDVSYKGRMIPGKNVLGRYK